MAEWFSAAILTAIKTAGPVIYTAAFAGSGLILFLPINVIDELGLTEFKIAHRTELGALFIGSASLVAAHAVFALWPVVREAFEGWRAKRNTRGFLKTLTTDEKKFLRPYVVNGENTRNESIYNGVANGLKMKGIIYPASDVTIPGRPGMQVPFNLSPYIRKVLTRNRSYLE